MIKFISSYAAIIACIVTLTYLHCTTGHKRHNINEYLVENKRTRFTKQNYVMQREPGNTVDSRLGDNGVQLYEETLGGEGSRKEDDIPALIVDYANMIRNDILLLDNSVETRTRKRGGNNKPNQAISDPPCSCQYNKSEIYLGDDTFPRTLETLVCLDTCPKHYACQERQYNITVLKRRTARPPPYELQEDPLPYELRHYWSAHHKLVTVGCNCLKDYVTQT